MPNIIVSNLPNLTLTAKLRSQTSTVTSETIALTESESGQYTGASALGNGVYAVDILSGANKLADDMVIIDGTGNFRVGNISYLYNRTIPSGNYFDSSNDEVTVGVVTSGAIVDMFSTYAITESYPATGVAATPAQLMYLTNQGVNEFGIVGTTLTVRKVDKSTTAAIYTLDDSGNPTDRTRAS